MERSSFTLAYADVSIETNTFLKVQEHIEQKWAASVADFRTNVGVKLKPCSFRIEARSRSVQTDEVSHTVLVTDRNIYLHGGGIQVQIFFISMSWPTCIKNVLGPYDVNAKQTWLQGNRQWYQL